MTCRLCGLQEETANHIVFECEAFEHFMRELRLDLNSEQLEIGTDIHRTIGLVV